MVEPRYAAYLFGLSDCFQWQPSQRVASRQTSDTPDALAVCRRMAERI